MKRSISMLLAILTLAGTLTLPSMAAEPDEEKGTAQEAVQEEESAQADGTEAEEAEPEPEPDPEGTVTWGNLDDRIRAESLNARILIENITGIEDIDYDQMYEDLRRQLNDIAQAQWMMILMGAGQAADALDQSYDSLRDVFDSIKDGELQADNADVVWQLEDTVNQVVSGGENLYITLVGLEQQAADGQRGLDTIDRNLEQLRLRQQLGQVSQQTVTELEQTRAQTVSQLATLDSNIRQLKIQLQNLMGRTPPGSSSWAPCPPRRRPSGRSPTTRPTWRPPRRPAGPCGTPSSPWTTQRSSGTTTSPATGAPASSICTSRRSTPGTPPSSPTSPPSRTLRPASSPCTTLLPTMSRCWKTPSPPWPGSRPCWRPPRAATTWG